jgi:hypothetical protein
MVVDGSDAVYGIETDALVVYAARLAAVIDELGASVVVEMTRFFDPPSDSEALVAGRVSVAFAPPLTRVIVPPLSERADVLV